AYPPPAAARSPMPPLRALRPHTIAVARLSPAQLQRLAPSRPAVRPRLEAYLLKADAAEPQRAKLSPPPLPREGTGLRPRPGSPENTTGPIQATTTSPSSSEPGPRATREPSVS